MGMLAKVEHQVYCRSIARLSPHQKGIHFIAVGVFIFDWADELTGSGS
jgi:hypothetical protein